MIAVVVAKRETVADALRRIATESGLDWEVVRHVNVTSFALLVEARRRQAARMKEGGGT